MKRPLRDLDRGTFFRTADGLLWQPGYPVAGVSRWCHAVGRPRDSTILPADTEVEVVDQAAVLARAGELERENAELRAVLYDLWQDRDGAAVGAELERGAVLEVLEGMLPISMTHLQSSVASQVIALAVHAVQSRGPWRPPVPPCALEGPVREVLAELEPFAAVMLPPELRAVLARLRAAVEPDGPVGRLDRSLGEG